MRLLNELFCKWGEERDTRISTIDDYSYIIDKIAQHGQLLSDEINAATKVIYKSDGFCRYHYQQILLTPQSSSLAHRPLRFPSFIWLRLHLAYKFISGENFVNN